MTTDHISRPGRMFFRTLTAFIRGTDSDQPLMAGTDEANGRIVMLLDPEYAEELAKIIAVGFPAVAGDLMGDEAVWEKAPVALLTAVEDFHDTALVPILGVAR